MQQDTATSTSMPASRTDITIASAIVFVLGIGVMLAEVVSNGVISQFVIDTAAAPGYARTHTDSTNAVSYMVVVCGLVIAFCGLGAFAKSMQKPER